MPECYFPDCKEDRTKDCWVFIFIKAVNNIMTFEEHFCWKHRYYRNMYYDTGNIFIVPKDHYDNKIPKNQFKVSWVFPK